MTDYGVVHDQDIHGPACENCNLLKSGCPVREQEVFANHRSCCSAWVKRARGPKGAALAALTGIARKRPYRP